MSTFQQPFCWWTFSFRHSCMETYTVWNCALFLHPFFPVFITMTNMSEAAAASTLPAATAGSHIRPSRCTITQGTTHCTCEPGYTISGRDSSVCTGVPPTFFFPSFLAHDVDWLSILPDIDECELFHNGQAGRLCLHACVNTPGGYRCSCPAGYNLSRDGRGCKGVYLTWIKLHYNGCYTVIMSQAATIG